MAPVFEMTTHEADALAKLKGHVKGILRPSQDDYALVQWLRAHTLDVEKTEQALRTSNETIRRMDLANFTPPKVVEEFYAGGLMGYAKDGSALKVELLGKLDIKGLMRATSRGELEKWKIREFERVQEDHLRRSEEMGKRVSGMTVVVDMEGVGSEWLWRPGLQLYIRLANLLEEHYPGDFRKLLVIKAPAIFPLMWKMVRTFLSDRIRNKVEVMGGNYKDELLEYVDVDELPAYMGGAVTDADGDPRCTQKICQGGKVPFTYYIPLEGELQGMNIKEIPSAQRFCLNFDVETPGSILSWAFRTEQNDIGFGINRQVDEDSMEEVIPQRRIPSQHVIEDGSVVCAKPGNYEVCFDNSFSWATPKTLYYQVEVHVRDDSTLEEIQKMTSAGRWEESEEGVASAQ